MAGKVRALVTGAGALLGQGIIQSLRRAPLNIEIIAVDPSPLAPGLYWADQALLVPLANAHDYIDRVRHILARERPDIVFIGTDVELTVFAEQRQILDDEFGTRVVVSSPEVVRIAGDKYLTYKFLKDNDFPAPVSCLPGEEEALLDSVGFPLIVKPRSGARSVGVNRVTDWPSLQKAIASGPDMIIQECVSDPDHEYTAGVVCFDGECRASIVMRRDLRDGNTFRAYVDTNPILAAQIRAVATKLGPRGPMNLQFRADSTTAKVFEINARFSGTTPLRALVGFNEVEMVLRRLLFGEPVEQPNIEQMIILRHYSETLVRPGTTIRSD